MKRLALALILLLAAHSAFADSIMMVSDTLQPDGSVNSFTPLVPGMDILLIAFRITGRVHFGLSRDFYECPDNDIPHLDAHTF